MDKRQDPSAEDREVALELADRADALLDLGTTRVPEATRIGIERDAAPRVQRPSPMTRPRSDELEQLGMRERSIGGNAKLERRKLRRVEVHGDDPRRIVHEHRERVLSR